jgi:hypothetical protein
MSPNLAPTSRTVLSKLASIAIGLCILLLGGTLQVTRSDAASGTAAHTYTIPASTPSIAEASSTASAAQTGTTSGTTQARLSSREGKKINGLNQSFLLPFLVTLLAGLTIYFVQFFRQRKAIGQALLGEINLLLTECRDYCAYLPDSSNEWLMTNTIVSASPYFAKSSYRVYSAMLPNLHILSRRNILRVIAFYGQYETCESLIEILFARIRLQEQSGLPTTDEQASSFRIRTERITGALRDILGPTDDPIQKLGYLKTVYSLLPASKESAHR